jgi:hypothetical protein
LKSEAPQGELRPAGSPAWECAAPVAVVPLELRDGGEPPIGHHRVHCGAGRARENATPAARPRERGEGGGRPPGALVAPGQRAAEMGGPGGGRSTRRQRPCPCPYCPYSCGPAEQGQREPPPRRRLACLIFDEETARSHCQMAAQGRRSQQSPGQRPS